MADQMQAIKRRIKSVSSTERITNAMKLVSAAKLRQATNHFEYIKKYLEKEAAHYEKILRTEEKAPTVYRESRAGKTLYIVLTSNKGLCGSYNASVNKVMDETAKKDSSSIFCTLGTKGKEHSTRENLLRFDYAAEQTDEIPFETVSKLAELLLKKYKEGELTGIKVIYASYLNSIAYEVKTRTIFPLKDGGEKHEDLAFVEYEPLSNVLFDGIAKEYLSLCVYSTIAEASLCEHSARRMAMKNASDNANEMLTELSVYYNRARQAAITNEIIEIIAGSEAQR